MSRFWDRFFYLFSFTAQGPSFLNPRAYAILHREHHAFADTERDPHSPLFFENVGAMMLDTKKHYDAYAYRRAEPEARFLGDTPEWPLSIACRRSGSPASASARSTRSSIGLRALGLVVPALAGCTGSWVPSTARSSTGAATSTAIRNFDTRDVSRNTLPFDFLTMVSCSRTTTTSTARAPTSRPLVRARPLLSGDARPRLGRHHRLDPAALPLRPPPPKKASAPPE